MVTPEELKHNWMYTAQKHTQQIGDQFVKKGNFLVLKVPSVIVPQESNYLFNPLHADFDKIKIVKTELFSLDSRLFN